MNRRILTIIVAVLLAGVGATTVLMYVNSADARALEGTEATTVLVASKPIPAGTSAKVAKDMLRAETMPVASVPSDALSRIDANLENLVTSADVGQGQLLTRSMLVAASEQDAIVLPEGKLAVSIPVEGGSQGDGQLKPGFKVAVFNTFTAVDGEHGQMSSGELLAFEEGKNHATRLLLASVDVIEVIAEKNSKDDSSNFGKFLVTVAVSQGQAERLIHALNTGTVTLALVNDESKVKPGKGIDNNRLFAN